MATLGIDLGTSALRAALVTDDSPTPLPIGAGDALTAAVSLAGGKTQVGEAALALAATDPDDTARSPSRLLSRSANTPPPSVTGAELGLPPRAAPPGTLQATVDTDFRGASAVTGLLIASVLRVAGDFGARVRSVAISRRTGADERQQNAIIEAAHSAGASLVSLVTEPVACAAGICEPGPVRPVVVVDVGASHVAASVLEVAEGLAPSLLFNESFDLGGEDIDRALMKLLLRQGREPQLDRGTAELLRQCCETLKRDLAASEITTFHLPPILAQRTGIVGAPSLTRPQLEEACSDVLGALGGCCRAAKRVLWEPSGRCELYLVGGLSRLPFVRAFVEEIFDATARVSDAVGSIARGAARLAAAMRDSEFASPPPSRPPSGDRHLVDISAPPPAPLPDVGTLPDSLPAALEAHESAPVARRKGMLGLPDADDTRPAMDLPGLPEPGAVRAALGLPEPDDRQTAPGLPAPDEHTETPGLPEPDAAPQPAGLPPPDEPPRPSSVPAQVQVRSPSASTLGRATGDSAPLSLGWPVQDGVPRRKSTRPSQRPTVPVPPESLDEYRRQSRARSTNPGTEPSPRGAQPSPERATEATVSPSDVDPSSGRIANPATLADVFALPLNRPITPSDVDPVSIPVLLLVLAGGAKTGRLILRMEGRKLLRVLVVRGWPAVSDAQFKMLAELSCTRDGTYEFKDMDVEPTVRQVRRPAPSIVAEALRRLVSLHSEQEVRDSLGSRLDDAPRVSSEHRRALARFQLTAMESRIISTSFDGKTSGARLLADAGPTRATLLTLMAMLTVAAMVDWGEGAS